MSKADIQRMSHSLAVPVELGIIFRMIRSSEAHELALTCFSEISNYIQMIDRLPRPGKHLRELVDRSVDQSLSRLQKYEKAKGVSAALIALGAYYSNEARRSFKELTPSISYAVNDRER
jgi:hypothetical protein